MLKNMYSDQSFFGNVPLDSVWGTGHFCLSLYQTTFLTCPNSSTSRRQKKCISKI